MNTAIAITAIIAAVAVVNIIVNAVTTKGAAHCKTCTCDKKENEA